MSCQIIQQEPNDALWGVCIQNWWNRCFQSGVCFAHYLYFRSNTFHKLLVPLFSSGSCAIMNISWLLLASLIICHDLFSCRWPECYQISKCSVKRMLNIGRTYFITAILIHFRFGRLRMLIIGMIASAISGMLQSFSTSYNMYLIMEFITSSFGTFLYGSGFVLALEWVSSQYRVLTSIIVSGTVPFSEVVLALCAMHFPNFRTLLLVIFSPGLLILFYHWLLPESTRWLYVSGRYNQAEANLRATARANNTKISQQSLDALRYQYQQDRANIDKQPRQLSFAPIFRNKHLLIRFANLSFCWVVNAFVYFGISITSAQMHTSTNKYISFMIISAAEIPGSLFVLILLDRIGRRPLISGALMLNGLAILASTQVHHGTISFLMFIIAKCAITCAFSSLYVFTAELWPTNLRNTMMNLCSMVGRLGGMLASSVIPLSYIAPELPFILYGSAALLAAGLVLLNPETNGCKLPDTFEDATKLSKNPDNACTQ